MIKKLKEQYVLMLLLFQVFKEYIDFPQKLGRKNLKERTDRAITYVTKI